MNNEATEVSISNMLGKELKQVEITQGATEIHLDVDDLPSGVYLIVLRHANNALSVKKIVLNKE